MIELKVLGRKNNKAKLKEEKLIELLSPEQVKQFVKGLNLGPKLSKLKPNKNNFKNAILEYVKHFKKDAWPLDFSYVKEDLFVELFGFSFSELIINELRKNNIDVGIGSKGNTDVIFINKTKKKSNKKVTPNKRKKKTK